MKRKTILSIALVVALVVACVALLACENTEQAGAYYLTGEKANNWAVYDADDKVPANLKLAQEGDSYKLTIKLAQGESFKIAQVNGEQEYGFDAIFSSEKDLTQGADNKINVAVSGTYVITLNTADNEITYVCTPDAPDTPELSPKYVDIDDAQNFTLTFGAVVSKQLSATVTMDDDQTTNHNVTWHSSNTAVATVSASGLVQAVSAGTAEITAKANDQVVSDPVTVSVNGVVTLNKTSLTLNEGAEETLIATVLGGDLTKQWRTSDDKIASVDQNGKVKAESAGSATIYLAYVPRAGVTPVDIECTVTVNKAVKEIKLNSNSISLPLGTPGSLTVSFDPENPTNADYALELSEGGEEIVEVAKNGLTITVTPKAVGTATLTVTSDDGGKTAECAITIVEEGEVTSAINVSNTHIYKRTGENTLELSVSLTNGTIESVEWSSDATDVATISGNNATATVTAVEYGKTTVTANITAVGGETFTETCQIVVAPDNFYLYGNVAGWWNAIDSAIDDYKFTENEGVYTLTLDNLVINDDFRIGDDDYFTSQWRGIRWEHVSATVRDNAKQGGNDQNGGRNVQVTVLGTYTLKIDLTKGKAVLEITCDAIAVTGIELEAGNSTLTAQSESKSTTVTLTVNPNNATYTAEDITWTCESQNVVMTIAENKMSVTITVNDDAENETVTVACSVKGKPATVSLTVIEAGAQVTPVTEINFQKTTYSFDLNEGWTGTVVASVNADASNTGVTYSTTESYITVNSSTGEVTASKIGTYTVIATASGDNTKTAEVKVTFYSSNFYLTGDANSWPTVGDKGKTKDDVINYIFTATDTSNTVFALNVALSQGSKFQVMFCETTSWTHVIKGEHLDSDASNATASGDNIVAGSAGLYLVTIDLSGTTPKITAVRTGDVPTFTATLLGTENTELDVSDNSVVVDNGVYGMNLEYASFVADGLYTIAIKNGEDAVATITVATFANASANDENVYFENGDEAIKCLIAGNYRLSVKYKALDNSCVIEIEIIKDSWNEVEGYGVAIYNAPDGEKWSNDGVATDVKTYYNTASGQYKIYFAYTKVSTEVFNAGLQKEGAWAGNIKPSSVQTYANNSATLGGTASDDNFWGDAGKYYFEVVFTVNGSEYTMVSLTVSDTDLNTLVA